jgi:hypothetical protein
MPDELRDDPALYTGCISGAATVDELRAWLLAAGFTDVRIVPKDTSREFIAQWAPGWTVEEDRREEWLAISENAVFRKCR